MKEETQIKKGDYVLATKWDDGDPGDNWGVGYYDRYENNRHFIVDNEGKQIRHGGFRKVRGELREDVGRWLIEIAATPLERSPAGTVNIWTMLSDDCFKASSKSSP